MGTTSLDLIDACYHIPIATTCRKYLRFVQDNVVHQFPALLYCLSTAPLVYTRIFQSDIAHLHQNLSTTGFSNSWKLSEVVPSQSFVFLQEHYRTNFRLVFPSQEKFLSLCQRISQIQASHSVTARQLLVFLNSLADEVPLGCLHIHPVQFYLLEHWTPSSQDWEAVLPVFLSLLPYL